MAIYFIWYLQIKTIIIVHQTYEKHGLTNCEDIYLINNIRYSAAIMSVFPISKLTGDVAHPHMLQKGYSYKNVLIYCTDSDLHLLFSYFMGDFRH
jgi:hypothetical protein